LIVNSIHVENPLTFGTFDLRFDGASVVVVGPNAAGKSNTIRVVACPAASPTTAAGAARAVFSGGGFNGVSSHWDGTRWRKVASPSQGSSVLNGVSDVSVRDALAVGSGGSGSLALRWNGSRWVTT
jgi:hypothetical protein